MFKGDPSRPLEDFLADVINGFHVKPLTYNNDSVKIAYMASLLVDNPKKWYRQVPVENPQLWPPFMTDWNEFVKEIKIAFGDQDRIWRS